MDFFITVMYFLIMVAIIFAAYVAAKWISLRYEKISSGRYIEQLDRVLVGRDRSIIIIRVGQKVLLLSCSAQGTTLISELDEGDLIPIKTQQTPDSFNSIFEGLIGKLPQLNRAEDKKQTLTLGDVKAKMESSLERIMKKRKGNEKSE
ncbi:MAG: flagellar biosynthetic protein FliO [Eubacteriales bacterium]|jgi:flagellar biogenesis protein FliO|nr:flagellar biosynthetic protein FliO [Eubacteriales bacterium]